MSRSCIGGCSFLLLLLLSLVAAKTVELKHDDGKQDDRISTAGTGHAVRFDRPFPEFHLTKVRIFGERYGGGYDPVLAIAKIYVCDGDLQPLAEADLPLEAFRPGRRMWVEAPLPAVQPPDPFYVLVDFFATARRGVYMGIDRDGSGHSLSARPGRPGRLLEKGEWMIRAVGAKGAPKDLVVLDPSTARELAYDDGTQDGKRSMAGSGHAVMFTAPRGEWYLAKVSLYGSRYGAGYDPSRTFFNLFLCDGRMRVLARRAYAYDRFPFGNPAWVTVDVPPFRVKGKFHVLACFDPTATKGVYLGMDAKKKSHSLQALPGRVLGRTGSREEWMIRAVLMQRAKKNRGKATPRSGTNPKQEEEPVDALQIAAWKERLSRLENEEDVAGMKKLIAGAAARDPEAAEALGAVHATKHVLVRTVGVPDKFARAVATLYETCYTVLQEAFGFEDGFCVVPGRRLHVHLLAEPGRSIALFTSPSSPDFPLVVNTMPDWKQGLSPPGRGGTHIVYGLCHELGHVLIGWEDSRHQWGHYLGSLLVDRVEAKLGKKTWPLSYDVLAEGSKRFLDEIEGASPDPGTDAGTARLFYEVGRSFGTKIWGRAIPWIKAHREGTPFHAVRRWRLLDLRDALLALGCDARDVARIFAAFPEAKR